MAGRWIFLPGVKRVKESARFILPVRGKVTSHFGLRRHPLFGVRLFHYGIDIRARKGAKVFASASGRVIFSGWKPGYGNLIIIKHRGGFYTYYAHNSINLVKRGDYVRQYQEIARVGNTGDATAAHLHFEIRKGKKHLDPLKYLH
jgi:murein DD-endopeptidase MepM/ murein hydrolase activator NlpD